MAGMRRLITCFLGILPGLLGAQSFTTYPDILSLSYYNEAMLNPGYVSEEGRSDLFFAHKFFTGALKDVNTSFFTADRTFRKESGATHVGRLLFFNERQGPYINKPSGYGNYAYQLPISERIRLYAGVSVGIAAANYTVPSSSGNQTATLPDGGIGVGAKGERWSAGGACLQVLNSSAQPYNATMYLGRYYQVHARYELPLSMDWVWKNQAVWRHLPETQDQYYLLSSIHYVETAGFGAIWRIEKGISFFVSLLPHYQEDRLLFSFTYNTAMLGDTPSWQNSMEFNIGYRIH